MAYIEKESFKHKLAKELLYKWLNDEDSNDEDLKSCIDWTWRKNQGVHLELKFHENDDVYYFENTTLNRGKILFVPDICIFHKGTPVHLIEVVNTNPVSTEKLKRITGFFEHHYLSVWEVSADDILSCDKGEIPSTLNSKLILEL